MRYILRFTIVLVCFLTPYVLEAQNAPSIEWQKCYGGTYTDGCQCMVRTEDGGYILCGSTNSHSGDVVGGHLGVYDDAWIVKIDSNGKLEWQKCLGGNFTEIAYSIIQCFDRGYLVVGLSNSHDGDIVRAIGDTGSTAIPWAAKLDSTGKLQWEKSLDGIVKPWFTGSAYTVIQTPDSNFIIGGEINGAEEGLINHGMFDAYIAKLSPSGVLLMQRAYGGDKDERVSSILQTTDGGYIFSGVTGSKNSGDVQGSTNSDLLHTWTVKLDQSFNIQWQKMLDGSQYGGDLPKIIHTKNHAFVVGSSIKKLENGVIYSDIGISKIDTIGNIIWQKGFGGSNQDLFSDLRATPDGNFIFLGATNSNDRDVHGFHASLDGDDIWMVKIDSAGQIIWDECLGSSGDDEGSSVLVLSENEYVVAGSSDSKPPLVRGNHGQYDYYVAKLVSNPASVSLPIVTEEQKNIFKLCPNPLIGKVTLQIVNASEVKETKYYDLLGREVFPHSYYDGNTLTIDTHLLPTAPFFAKINYLISK